MEVNTDAVLKEENGDEVVDPTGSKFTLGMACQRAIRVGYAESKDVGLKYKMGKVSFRLSKGGVVNLKADEIQQIKECSAVFMPHIVAQIHDLLDPQA